MSIKQMTRVWEHSQHKGSELLLLLAIADYADDDGSGCFASIETLAKKTRMSTRNVQYLIQRAEESGELEVSRRTSKFGTNEYRLHVGHANFAPPHVDEDTKSVSSEDTKATSSPDTKATSSNTSVNTSEEPKEGEAPFYAVAKNIYGFEKNEIPNASRQLVGRALKALQEAKGDISADDVKGFAKWWREDKDDIALPRDPAKLQAHWIAYEQSASRVQRELATDGSVEMGGWQ